MDHPALPIPPARNTNYTHAELRRLIAPRSVAVLGASTRAGAFGQRTVEHLGIFSGAVYPVNEKYEEVGGFRCYAELSALPEVPDCAIITVGREAVEPLLLQAAQAGIGGAVIYAAGYAETSLDDRIAQQARLAAIADQYGIRVMGPNCMGLFNHGIGLNGSFAPEVVLPRPASRGTIGIVSQSGAVGLGLAQACQLGLSLSHMLTAGNSCDVDVGDLVAYLADDPTCQAIACVFEGMAKPQRIIAAAERAKANGKPLVIYKTATGEQGAQAAMSHTGSLAGSSAAYRAAFERAGAVLVDDLEALLETAHFFAKAGAPSAAGVAVVTTSGGAGIMAADKAEQQEVPMPQPGADTTAVLVQHIPEFGSARNPCDVTAQVVNDPRSLQAVGGALMTDTQYGALVFPCPSAASYTVQRVPIFEDLASQYGKPVCMVWMSPWMQGPGMREAMEQQHTPVFHSMDRCFATLSAWQRRHERLQRGERHLLRRSSADAAQRAAALIDAAPNRVVGEREAKAVLAAYGVPVVGESLVHDAAQAVAAAEQFGFPVVLKVDSPDLPHKTDAGVVRLGLANAQAVAAAYADVMANAARVQPAPHIHGVLVQPMVRTGTEVMIGGRVDPHFGPLVVAGLGGVLVELMQDVALDLAPVTSQEADAMLAGLKGRAAMDGFRGSPPVDRARLADIVVRLSELMADQADRIAELDVNPLICHGERIVAVDALIIKR